MNNNDELKDIVCVMLCTAFPEEIRMITACYDDIIDSLNKMLAAHDIFDDNARQIVADCIATILCKNMGVPEE